MKKSFLIAFAIISFFGAGIASSCTEPFQMQTNTFEDALVIEATITNELKKQEIKLSRTYRFEDDGPVFESGAEVFVTDDTGVRYDFAEQDGVYASITEFQAVSGRNYQLFITTDNGKRYESTTQSLTTVNEMNDVTANVETQHGVRGVSIKAHSNNPTNSSIYYRYEYEETYKVVAPYWNSFKMIKTGPEEITLVPRTTEARTCYGSAKSTDILLANTSGMLQDRLDFQARFISDQNYIISHRYSILVRQYIERLEAYTYYKNLKKLSSGGNILSPNQPGFLNGNLKSLSDPKEKVIGFFEVASVSSKRIFFNYADLFPGEALPPYRTKCTVDTLKYCFDYTNLECEGWALVSYASIGAPVYYNHSADLYYLVPSPCGDCSTFASNVIPPFWQ
jgi:hypothetical protein